MTLSEITFRKFWKVMNKLLREIVGSDLSFDLNDGLSLFWGGGGGEHNLLSCKFFSHHVETISSGKMKLSKCQYQRMRASNVYFMFIMPVNMHSCTLCCHCIPFSCTTTACHELAMYSTCFHRLLR